MNDNKDEKVALDKLDAPLSNVAEFSLKTENQKTQHGHEFK